MCQKYYQNFTFKNQVDQLQEIKNLSKSNRYTRPKSNNRFAIARGYLSTIEKPKEQAQSKEYGQDFENSETRQRNQILELMRNKSQVKHNAQMYSEGLKLSLADYLNLKVEKMNDVQKNVFLFENKEDV